MQTIIFSCDEPIDSVVNKNSNKMTKFLAWYEANKKYLNARRLTYADFPTQFVYRLDLKEWTPRKSKFSIGRSFYTPLGKW